MQAVLRRQSLQKSWCGKHSTMAEGTGEGLADLQSVLCSFLPLGGRGHPMQSPRLCSNACYPCQGGHGLQTWDGSK
jgi:hypothetical protein